MRSRKLILYISLILLLPAGVLAQSVRDNDLDRTDSLLAVRYLNSGISLYNSNFKDSSLNYFEKSLDLAQKNEYLPIEAKSYFYLGLISNSSTDWEITLRYYLKASSIFINLNDSIEVTRIYGLIGRNYFNLGAYSMALDYASQEFDLHSDMEGRVESGMLAARSAYLIPDYEESIYWYNVCYKLASEQGNTKTIVETLYGLTGAKLDMDRPAEVREHLNELLALQSSTNETVGIADVYNSLGLLEFNSGNIDGAINNYLKAVDYYKISGVGAESAYSNLAICYQNKGNDRLTEEYFELALKEAEDFQNIYEAARLEHALAVLNFKKGDLYHADYYSLASIRSSKEAENYNQLQQTYETYSEILQEGNNFVKALDYFQLHLALKDSLDIEERFREQATESNRSMMESYEQQLRLTLADDELRDLELRNLRIENEKRANDLLLLEKENEVSSLESQRLQQDIALEKERYASTIQEKEILLLEQERMKQREDSTFQEYESRKLIQEKNNLEYEASLRELELQKEQDGRRRARLLSILAGFTVIVILVSLISARRRNATLTAQKKIIEEKNITITDSIEYASRIQNAVIPPPGFLNDWGLDSFIMYRPKDIVSGDFYWGVKSGENLCFAAADCTGHGVPGAFMSMLGTAFLNEIINSRQFNNAADILNQLRNEVITSLRQRGVEGEAQDGMDISLCIYNKEENILHFAGANNPLYHVRSGNLERVGPDKMPIGIHVSLDKPFTNYRIIPEKGDTIYLFSDGYADQFGGPEGKKFKYKPFRDMLLEVSSLPLIDQKQIVEERFDSWRENTEQVDDVILMGIRF